MVVSLFGFTGMALLLRYLGAERGVSPWMALLFRAGVGMAVVGLISASGKRVDFRRALFSRLLISRGIMGAFGTAAYYMTLPILGAGKATLIGNTWVIWSAILAVIILGEHLTPKKIAGTLLAIAGIALLTGLQGGDFSQLGRYEMIAVGGALIAAATVVVIRQLTRTESSATIFAAQCAYTALLAIPFIIGLPRPPLADLAMLGAAAVLAALGQLAMTEGFRFLPVGIGGAFQVLLPLTITVAGVAFFNETFTGMQVAGAALILTGTYQTVTAKAPVKPA